MLPATMLVQFGSISHLGLPAGRWGRILDGHIVRKPRVASMLDAGRTVSAKRMNVWMDGWMSRALGVGINFGPNSRDCEYRGAVQGV